MLPAYFTEVVAVVSAVKYYGFFSVLVEISVCSDK